MRRYQKLRKPVRAVPPVSVRFPKGCTVLLLGSVYKGTQGRVVGHDAPAKGFVVIELDIDSDYAYRRAIEFGTVLHEPDQMKEEGSVIYCTDLLDILRVVKSDAEG